MKNLYKEKTMAILKSKGFSSFEDVERYLLELKIAANEEHRQSIFSVNPAAINGGTLESVLGMNDQIKSKILTFDLQKREVRLYKVDDKGLSLKENNGWEDKKYSVSLSDFENWAERI